MDNLIQVEARARYGGTDLHPMNHQAKLLAQLAGTKTLTPGTLDIAKELGFEISVIPQQLPVYDRWARA